MTVPKGWTTAKLGDFTLERVDQGEPGASAVPYIDIGSIDRDLKRVGPTQRVTSANAPTRARQWVKSGDVLVSLTRPNLNAVATVPPELDGAVASTGFDVLRPRGVLPEWVFNRVRSQMFVLDVCEGVQGVVYPAVRPADVRRHELPIPPAQEQRRIVEAIDSYLSRLDDAVANLERVQAKLKAYRASVLKAAVEGRLVPTEAALARSEKRAYEPAEALLARILKERRRRWEETELAKLRAAGKTPKDDKWQAKYQEPAAPDTSTLAELPEGWCWASCAQVLLRLQTGPFGSTLHRSDYVAGGTPVINPQHLRDDGIHPSDKVTVAKATLARLSVFRLAAGDIVLARRGEMGRCALVRPREDGWLLGTGSLALRAVEGVDGNYFSWVMRGPRTVRILEHDSVGTTMTNLNQAILLGLPVPLAPVAEQVRIVQEIERQLSVIEELGVTGARQQTRCGRLRQAILKWAFEGKLVDQDPTDEPAERLLARIRADRAAAAPPKKSHTRTAKGAA